MHGYCLMSVRTFSCNCSLFHNAGIKFSNLSKVMDHVEISCFAQFLIFLVYFQKHLGVTIINEYVFYICNYITPLVNSLYHVFVRTTVNQVLQFKIITSSIVLLS